MRLALATALALAVPGVASAAAPSDLRDYAIASCLIKQTASPPLRDEGFHLASIVIRRAGIDPFTWKPLQTAVEASLAARGLLMIHVDGPVAESTRPAPLASCLQAIDTPGVQRIMARLAHKR